MHFVPASHLSPLLSLQPPTSPLPQRSRDRREGGGGRRRDTDSASNRDLPKCCCCCCRRCRVDAHAGRRASPRCWAAADHAWPLLVHWAGPHTPLLGIGGLRCPPSWKLCWAGELPPEWGAAPERKIEGGTGNSCACSTQAQHQHSLLACLTAPAEGRGRRSQQGHAEFWSFSFPDPCKYQAAGGCKREFRRIHPEKTRQDKMRLASK